MSLALLHCARIGLACWLVAATAIARGEGAEPDRTVAKLVIKPTAGSADVEVWLTRARRKDGGVVIKIITRGVAPRPQALTIYAGGGEDDGPGNDAIRGLTASALELASGQRVARVDFTYTTPGGPRDEEQTDTVLVGLAGRTRRVLELRTKIARDRSPVCRESTETELSSQLGSGGLELVAETSVRVSAKLGDDDLPLDRECKAPRAVSRESYRWVKDRFEPPAAP